MRVPRRCRPPTAGRSARPTAAPPGSAASRCKNSERLRSKDSRPRATGFRRRGRAALIQGAVPCLHDSGSRRSFSPIGAVGRQRPCLLTALPAATPPRRHRSPRAAAQDSTTTDARRSGGAGRHRLQLRHRARSRRPQPPARARHVRPAFHGHRRHGESGDRALPIADRAVARQRARAELRVRPARAREAAAEVRRPRRHARADAAGRRTRRAKKK